VKENFSSCSMAPWFVFLIPKLRQSPRFGKGLGHRHDIGIKEVNPHHQQTSSLGFTDRTITKSFLEAVMDFCHLLEISRSMMHRLLSAPLAQGAVNASVPRAQSSSQFVVL
jgi:hypothetical protein